MQQIAGYIDQAGFPPGVFNLVNGDKVAGGALVDSPRVKGVSFVGSSAVGRIVAEKCAKTGKRFQAMGSAKNHLVVMPDAKMEHVVRNMVTSCFGCAGQRCMAAAAIVCVGERTHEEVVERFVSAAGKVPVADPLDPAHADEDVLIGPVISAAARERILGLIADGLGEGATLALDGRGVVVEGRENGYFIGPTVFVNVRPGMKVHRTEIFGPVVVVLKAGSLDEAIAIINDHPYGNGASIYTQNGHYARRFKLEAACGMIGVNVGIPAPAACLPFGGMRASLLADIKTQATAAVRFFTEEKTVTERFWPED
jgi:malonate-semialdehyde dehydrogenase (acetylating)/methylmalonate-semialdehyde dehydrogenase